LLIERNQAKDHENTVKKFSSEKQLHDRDLLIETDYSRKTTPICCQDKMLLVKAENR